MNIKLWFLKMHQDFAVNNQVAHNLELLLQPLNNVGNFLPHANAKKYWMN
jgi:hypothetical protein